MYRSTPHCTTGRTPSELHLGRRLSTRLTRVQPNDRASVEKKQNRQAAHASGHRTSVFREGDDVLVRNADKKTWTPGKVQESSSDGLRYRVLLQHGRERVVHLDHMVAGSPHIQTQPPTAVLTECSPTEPTHQVESEPHSQFPSDPVTSRVMSQEDETMYPTSNGGSDGVGSTLPKQPLRRSNRPRRAPIKLNL